MPVFVEHTRLQWQPYRIISGVIHIGPHARAGHYRAFLAEETGPGEWQHLVTDDGIGSKVAASTMSQVIRKNCYLCMLTRLREPCTPTGTLPSLSRHNITAGASASSVIVGPSTDKPPPKKKKKKEKKEKKVAKAIGSMAHHCRHHVASCYD